MLSLHKTTQRFHLNNLTHQLDGVLFISHSELVTGGQPHFRMVITAQDGVSKRYVELVIDGLNQTMHFKLKKTNCI